MDFSNYIMTFFLCMFLHGCCTQKDCDSTEPFSITLRVELDTLTGFTHDETKTLTIIVTDQTFNILDSFLYWNVPVDFTVVEPVVILSNELLYNRTGRTGLNSYYYLFEINSVINDTLTDINFSYYSEEIDCNSCFPFGDGSATSVTINNLSYFFNAVKVTGKSDTLVIRR